MNDVCSVSTNERSERERLTVHFQEQAEVLFQINDAQRNVFCNMLYGSSRVKLCYVTINKFYTAETFDRHLQDTLSTIFTCSILSSLHIYLQCYIYLQAMNVYWMYETIISCFKH